MKCPLTDEERVAAAISGYTAWSSAEPQDRGPSFIWVERAIATAAYRKALEWSIQEVDWSIESVKQREQIRAKLAEMEDE